MDKVFLRRDNVNLISKILYLRYKELSILNWEMDFINWSHKLFELNKLNIKFSDAKDYKLN
ncbi:MAG: hypothetical protein EBZ95_10660 [Chitinophagia bacterium]|nr:hypothetical protein [Chitinophagia bacterium]